MKEVAERISLDAGFGTHRGRGIRLRVLGVLAVPFFLSVSSVYPRYMVREFLTTEHTDEEKSSESGSKHFLAQMIRISFASSVP